MYANVIRQYNGSRAPNGSRTPFAISTLLTNQLKRNGVDTGDALTSWNVVTRILGEDEFNTDPYGRFVGAKGIGEQQYASLIRSLRDADGTGAAVQQFEIRQKLLRGSVRSLSAQFALYVQKIVEGRRDLGAVTSGGVPSILSDVVRFVRSSARTRSAASSTSQSIETTRPFNLFWSVLFYLLRCGASRRDIRTFFTAPEYKDYRALVESEQQAMNISGTQSVMMFLCQTCELFHEYTNSFDGVTSAQAKEIDMIERAKALRMQWRAVQSSANASGFRDAVLNMVSFSDPSLSLPSTCDWTMEDFLWHKLCFVLRPHASGSAGQPTFKLQHWANVVIDSRKQFVEGGKNPYIYFRALLYCLEFERALAFLATAAPGANSAIDASHWFSDAVHIALTLHHYGVLRIASKVSLSSAAHGGGRGEGDSIDPHDSSSAFLMFAGSRNIAHLRLIELVKRQLRPFVRERDAKTAFEYVFALWQKHVGTSTSEDLVPRRLISLMVEVLLSAGTDQFTDLLNYLTQGEHARLSLPQCTQLTNEAASRANEYGLVREAISLWSLDRVGHYETAVRVLNQQLSIHLMIDRRRRQESSDVKNNTEMGVANRERKELFSLATKFYNQSQHHEKMRQKLSVPRAAVERNALSLFIHLYEYVDMCQNVPARYPEALSSMQGAPLNKLIPSREVDLADCVDYFFAASDSIRQKTPELLLMHMRCLNFLHATGRRHGDRFDQRSRSTRNDGPFATGGSQQNVENATCPQLRAKAALLVKFASMIDRKGFAISDSVYSKLSTTHMSME